MRFIHVSFQKFFRCAGRWYTSWHFPLDLLFSRLDARVVTFWGRLYDIPEPGPYVELAVPPDIDAELRFAGPMNSNPSRLAHVAELLKVCGPLKRAVRDADVVWMQALYTFPMLAWRYLLARQVSVVQQGGDPLEGADYSANRGLYARYRARKARRMSDNADLSVFVSQALADRYSSNGPNVMVANNSQIREQMLCPPRPTAEPGKLRAVFVGRLSPEKRLGDLIEAMAEVPEVYLALIGYGDEQPDLQAKAKERGCADRIEWAGRLRWGPELFDRLRAADVFVLVSGTEGMPRSVLEAMTQGLPVLATRVGGLPEVVRDGESGLLVDPARPDQIAAALRRLIDQPGLRDRLAAGAFEIGRRNTVEQQFGAVVDRIRSLHESKAARFGGGDS
jgi:glycosyltransferase involved in cell wall biosynthesis